MLIGDAKYIFLVCKIVTSDMVRYATSSIAFFLSRLAFAEIIASTFFSGKRQSYSILNWPSNFCVFVNKYRFKVWNVLFFYCPFFMSFPAHKNLINSALTITKQLPISTLKCLSAKALEPNLQNECYHD